MNKIAKFVLLILFIFFSVIWATIWHVDEDFLTIQFAINNQYVDNGDTISVRNGTPEKPTTWGENINFSGKNIVVINRDFLGGSNNPATCIIDGGQNGSVVTFNNGEGVTQDAILKGFTIQNGTSGITFEGGGIYCSHSSPRIENNIIKDNGGWDVTMRGGGIAIDGRPEPDKILPIISNNIIRNNKAAESGAGIFYTYAHPVITNNEIVCDSSSFAGGGIGSYYDMSHSPTLITGNRIDSNYASMYGRALYFQASNAIIRNNKIRYNNNPTVNPYTAGINCEAVSPDFGNVDGEFGPGYNWIEDNGDTNIIANSTMWAEGNYWATIHTPDITSRLRGEIYFDPIAASDRVASVTYNSDCRTGVIATGDLTIDPEVTLTIAPGKAFCFTTTADINTGTFPTLCELLVNGNLEAIGTENEQIKFTSFATSPQPGNWYGIRLRPNSGEGRFENCTVEFAYCGIDAIGNSTLSVVHSTIEYNQVYGILIGLTQNAEISESEINSNIYGICSEQAAPIISNNEILNNTSYGIWVINTNSATVVNNHVAWVLPFQPPTLYGILLGQDGNEVCVDNNRIEQWSQGGVLAMKGSEATMTGDAILDNGYYGILCIDASCPIVRWCEIENNDEGVHGEGNSYPDLGRNDFDPGNNSIDVSNYYYVVNHNYDQHDPIKAIKNWWGVDPPIREKFVGNVDYSYWLPGPPEGKGGGQSAGTITTTPSFALYAPKPNPASRDVKIAYSLPSRCKAELYIYNASGRIMTKYTEEKEAGYYEYLWNSREIPNGVYIVRLTANNNLCTQKLVISR
jgi:hypothetical protein